MGSQDHDHALDLGHCTLGAHGMFQDRLARQFGEPTIGHAVFGHVEGYPEVYSVAKNRTANENREQMMVTPWSGWHTDVTAAVNPPFASILRGVTIPP